MADIINKCPDPLSLEDLQRKLEHSDDSVPEILESLPEQKASPDQSKKKKSKGIKNYMRGTGKIRQSR